MKPFRPDRLPIELDWMPLIPSMGRANRALATLYLSNPDLVERFVAGAHLNVLDSTTIYTPGAHGYTDYPTLSHAPPVSPIALS